MKKFPETCLLLLFLCAFSMSLYAQQTFIPLKEGVSLEYEITGSDGKIEGYTINRIEKVEGCGEECFTVTYSSEFLDKNGKAKRDKNIMTVKVKDGNLYSDPSLFVLHGKNTVSGDVSVIFTGLNPGDRLNDYVWNARIGIFSVSVSNLGRHVTAAGQLSVPAGTFMCYEVEAVSVINMLGIEITNTTRTWYAAGIGPVRSDVYDRRGKLRQSRILVRLSGQ